ncbi:unnamed protein product [Caenorhabditis angaria]|uniref:Serrate RNA effector molecule homolog n=1 Tax=Caenorhabditis angaria TaxID=860376 RepID=A0A9P1I351_9PELO|nr:unnamed protein product [Caenorhabditis angaria]
MFDSDEDSERRRDKFARERRDDDRRGGGGGGYSRYDGGQKRPPPRRDDYQVKRSRNDDPSDTYEPTVKSTEETPSGDIMFSGPMLTFKRFLATQDDDISDEVAVKKYNDYKIEYKKHQLERFFKAHKDEEWFKQKYNPQDAQKITEAHAKYLEKRIEVFNDLKNSGQLEGFSLDYENAEKIIRLLDTVVVKLEDGSEEDLKAVQTQKIEDESLTELNITSTGSEEVKEETKTEESEEGAIDDEKPSAKVSIHKPSSIFIRNIHPTLTYEELESLCKRSPGFLRLALTDGIAERKFFRRGWATFRRDVNIKEICWNLNNFRVRDTDLNCIINRDMTRKIRSTNGISAHKTVATNDLKLALKLVVLCDKRAGLFNASGEPEEEREKDIRMGVDLISASTNPIIKDIKNIVPKSILEEISEEEAELLGNSNGDSSAKSDDKIVFERDPTIIKALDLLIIYLRIVHSVDFYNHGVYALEDQMPNRCGMFHVRGQPPSGAHISTNEDGNLVVPQKFVQDFTSGFNSRIEKALIEKQYVNEEEQIKLGKKDEEKEIDDFVAKNTVELAKDKWLCPLSGKKFKGPEFIKKHLQSKHEDKLNEVRADVIYFNNYVADASRPVDLERPNNIVPSNGQTRDNGHFGGTFREERGGGYNNREEGNGDRGGGGYRNSFGGNNYDRNRGPPRNNMGGGYGGPRNSGGGRYFDDNNQQPRRDNRPQVSYRDLDAPEDIP